jgi:hypothetical protein
MASEKEPCAAVLTPHPQNTLILVTFDENHSYTSPNRVFSILLGGAVPQFLHGTTDSNYYGTPFSLQFGLIAPPLQAANDH